MNQITTLPEFFNKYPDERQRYAAQHKAITSTDDKRRTILLGTGAGRIIRKQLGTETLPAANVTTEITQENHTPEGIVVHWHTSESLTQLCRDRFTTPFNLNINIHEVDRDTYAAIQDCEPPNPETAEAFEIVKTGILRIIGAFNASHIDATQTELSIDDTTGLQALMSDIDLVQRIHINVHGHTLENRMLVSLPMGEDAILETWAQEAALDAGASVVILIIKGTPADLALIETIPQKVALQQLLLVYDRIEGQENQPSVPEIVKRVYGDAPIPNWYGKPVLTLTNDADLQGLTAFIANDLDDFTQQCNKRIEHELISEITAKSQRIVERAHSDTDVETLREKQLDTDHQAAIHGVLNTRKSQFDNHTDLMAKLTEESQEIVDRICNTIDVVDLWRRSLVSDADHARGDITYTPSKAFASEVEQWCIQQLKQESSWLLKTIDLHYAEHLKTLLTKLQKHVYPNFQFDDPEEELPLQLDDIFEKYRRTLSNNIEVALPYLVVAELYTKNTLKLNSQILKGVPRDHTAKESHFEKLQLHLYGWINRVFTKVLPLILANYLDQSLTIQSDLIAKLDRTFRAYKRLIHTNKTFAYHILPEEARNKYKTLADAKEKLADIQAIQK